jgi:GNAT superfamily N-acetyltransferase
VRRTHEGNGTPGLSWTRRSRLVRVGAHFEHAHIGLPVSLLIRVEPIGRLSEHADIPIAFTVERILEISLPDDGLGGIAFNEVPVEVPWEKDYDRIRGEGPTRWPQRFDTSNWGLIAAYDGSHRVGGAVIAFNTAGITMLEGSSDIAVLWDLRVRPAVRRSGVGARLFRAVEEWARQRGSRTLKVETQTVNVPACRFYARMGCMLGSINRFAYPELPDETQLVWVKGL